MHKKRIAMAMMSLMLVGGLCNVSSITAMQKTCQVIMSM